MTIQTIRVKKQEFIPMKAIGFDFGVEEEQQTQ
jgi:hypothetical protein